MLVKGTEVVATYRDKMDAIADGYRRFGNVPFYVKNIERFESPVFMHSRLLAV